jgi:hypothetical protein
VAVEGGSGRGSYSIFKYKMYNVETKPEEHNGMLSTRIAKTINGLTQPYLPYLQTRVVTEV